MNPVNELSIGNQEKGLECDRARRLAADPRAKLPLMRQVHSDPEGKPLKTSLALKFPNLTRRQRRELQRAAIKFHRKTAKATQ